MLRYKYSTFAKVWIKYCSNIVHIHVNGTVCIILCELPFIEWHAKFTLPLNLCLTNDFEIVDMLESQRQETVRVYTVL